MDWNYNYLQCFVIVAETANISDAARVLGISQPSVSRQIRLLEEQLGSHLFIRDQCGVHLTPEGKRFKEQITPLFTEMKTVMQGLKDETSRFSGEISIGSLVGVGQERLMKIFLDFHQQHPQITLSIEFLRELEIIEKLKDGDLDFGIITSPIEHERVKNQFLMSEFSTLVTRGKNKKDLESADDFKQVSFVVYRKKQDSLLENFLRKFFPKVGMANINNVIAVNSYRSMIEALTAVESYAVMPVLNIEKELKNENLRRASRHELNGKLYLAEKQAPVVRQRHTAFEGFILKACHPFK